MSSANVPPADHVSPTGVVFSTARNVPTLAPKGEEKDSRPGSIHDAEKADSTYAEDEKNLANYLVPALEKGQKNARLKPPTLWIRFRVWYNPYRIVSTMTAQ